MRQHWTKHKLIEITTKIGSGATPKGGQKSYKKSGTPLVRSLNVYDREFRSENLAFIDDEQASKLNNVIVERGDIFLNITGASVARCCAAPDQLGSARVNQHVAIIRPIQNYVSPSFLEYCLTSPAVKTSLLSIGDEAGATRQALTKSQLQDFEIFLPPLDEQKRIVAILDKAFAAIDHAIANTKQNLANAQELFESYLNAVFTQKGEGWIETSLSKLIEITHGFAFKGSEFNFSKDPTKPIVLTPGNYAESGELYFTEKNTKRFFGDLPEQYLFEVGDLTVVMTDLSSKMKLLGKPAFIGQPGILHNQRIGRVKFKEPTTIPKYVYYFLRTRMASHEIKKTSTGTMVRHTAPKRILALRLRLPPTQSDQLNIVAELDELSAQTRGLEELYHRKLRDLAELKQSILQKAFTGELMAVPEKALGAAVA